MWEKNRNRVQELAANLGLVPKGRGAVSAQVEAEAGDLAEALRFAVDDDLSLFQFWPKLFAFCRFVNGLLSTGALTGPDATPAPTDPCHAPGVVPPSVVP